MIWYSSTNTYIRRVLREFEENFFFHHCDPLRVRDLFRVFAEMIEKVGSHGNERVQNLFTIDRSIIMTPELSQLASNSVGSIP